MAPLPPGAKPPRLVVYHQTIYDGDKYVSMVNLAKAGATHIIIAAVHLHAEDPQRIHINDDPPSHPKFDVLWREKRELEARGVQFLCMLGGDAPGSFSPETLDVPNRDTFLRYYGPLRDMIRRYGFHGIDLGVEQPMTLPGAVRLVDALHTDFGPDFLITLSPVATALVGMPHLSGFDYFDLEAQRGSKIAWYNVQFYNNWGNIESLDTILMLGWKPSKVVMGVLTNGQNGSTQPPSFDEMRLRINNAAAAHQEFGGIFGWEYFNANPGGKEKPWLWVEEMRRILGLQVSPELSKEIVIGSPVATAREPSLVDGEEDEAQVPESFEYDTDVD